MADTMSGGTLEEFGVKISLMFSKEKAEEAQAAIKKIGDELRHTAFEAAGAAAALFAIGNNFTANARELEEQADMLGLNTKQLQEYEYAAKVAANVNREELVGSLQHLGDMMDRARAGDQDARQAMLQLAHAGIGEQAMLQKLSDKSYTSADAMKDLSAGFQNIAKQSPQAAARLAEFAFGSAKLMPLLKQGPQAFDNLAKEADKNFVLNEKMIKQGAEMDRQFTRIWLTMKKFAYEIGFNVMKHIKPLVDQFTRWFAANKNLIASGINGFLDELVEVMETLFFIASDVWTVFTKVGEVFGGMGNLAAGVLAAFVAFKTLMGIVAMIDAFVKINAAIKSIAVSFELLGAAEGIALAPILAWALAIAGAVALIHDAYTIWKEMHEGKTFDEAKKDTWTGKGINKVKSMFAGGEKNANEVATGSAGQGAPGVGEVNQENTFTTNMTVTVPHGTTPLAASNMVSKAAVDAHEKMMIKAKLDGARKQIQ